MGTKNNPGVFDCYGNAERTEPMFTLLARSAYSAALVNLYAAMKRVELASIDGPPPDDAGKVLEAEQCANDMIGWRCRNRPDADDPAGIRTLAEGLVVLAERCGVSLRIEPTPLQPLRMGNYWSKVYVEKRHAPPPEGVPQ